MLPFETEAYVIFLNLYRSLIVQTEVRRLSIC
jgi:hypothetical protein